MSIKFDWSEKPCVYDFNDKVKSTQNYIKYMLLRTQSMFKYTGLPESIPQKHLERMIQTNGSVGIISVNGTMYACAGAFAGEPNPYYIPKLYTIANPALKIGKSYVIDDDVVVIGNDSFYVGLFPLMSKYATQLSENDISMRMVDINTRIQSIIAAGDERTKEAAIEYLKGIEAGKLGAIYENQFLDGIKTQPFGFSGSNNAITSLIEYHQFCKASFFNEIGIQSNYNMKRESINSNEAQLNEDALYPLIDNMLITRKEAIEKVNDMFGTSITVDLDSSWKDNRTELEAELEKIENEDIVEESKEEEIEDEEN